MRYALGIAKSEGRNDSNVRYGQPGNGFDKIPAWVSAGDFLQLPPPMRTSLVGALCYFETIYRRKRNLDLTPPVQHEAQAAQPAYDKANRTLRKLQRDLRTAKAEGWDRRYITDTDNKINELYAEAACRAFQMKGASQICHEGFRYFAEHHQDVIIFDESRRCDSSESGMSLIN